jgi:hypothetical protein
LLLSGFMTEDVPVSKIHLEELELTGLLTSLKGAAFSVTFQLLHTFRS